MTVTELMQVTGKSRDIIIARVKKLCPEIVFKPKAKTELTDEQSRKILEDFVPKFSLEDYPVERKGKTSRIIYEKAGPGYVAEYIKQMGKYLSKEEMRDFILGNPQITASKEVKKLKKPDEEKG